MSQTTGNLPAQTPDAKDDLYTNVNYGFLRENQGKNVYYISTSIDEVQNATIAALKDESRTDHELEQMRIFFDQAADLDTLKEIGLSEVQPYIDMIDSVESIEELNALLTSDDFPFTPFVLAILGTADMRGENIVAVYPNFVLCDPLTMGGTYYQESDDPERQQQNDNVLKMRCDMALCDMDLIMKPGDDSSKMENAIIEFEKAYGKDSYCDANYLSADYGAYSKVVEEGMHTLDELCALWPNAPLREMLAKCKKDGASTYIASSHVRQHRCVRTGHRQGIC